MRRDRRRFTRPGLVVASFCLLATATVQAEIYKCTGPDGVIVYSQLPCVPQKPVEPEKTEPDERTETAQPVAEELELPVTAITQEEPKSEANRTACKKRFRDAIDAIDAEIGREYSQEKGEQYKQRLLVLTRELRQC